MKGDDLSERLLDFAVQVVKLVEALPKNPVRRHVGGQLLRSATFAGANYEEARGAESRADFAHKLGIAWKEVRESAYWLTLIHRARLIEQSKVASTLDEARQLSLILGKSLATTKGQSKTAPDSSSHC